MRFQNTLFARTSLTIAGALLIFILFTGFVVLNYVLLPVARQSAGDLAALMVLSAKTWVELPPSARQGYQRELLKDHDLILRATPPETGLRPLVLHTPYMLFLEEALSSRLGSPVHVHRQNGRSDLRWVLLPVGDTTLYVGVHHDHIGAEPPRAAIIILLGASLFILLTTLLVVRRITRPLEALSRGVQRLGSGGHHRPLPEKGPMELANLARKFNQLSNEIHQLLDNRTTLLGGISHDLRTPLSRLRLAVELLRGKEDAKLLGNMRHDMEEMDTLITRTLELAKMMRGDEIALQNVDLAALLNTLKVRYAQQGRMLDVERDAVCVLFINRLILHRILSNLLDNAFHYTAGQGVALRLRHLRGRVEICVLDRGAGIPPDQAEKVFQPFYRLDQSRNRGTGGSGLGLAIVRQLAELQGWKVSLRNRADGGLAACVEIFDAQP